MYKIEYHKKVLKEIQKIKKSGLSERTQKLIEIIKENPNQTPPPYEKLQGDLNGLYSRRINIQHRLVYEIVQEKRCVRILSMWSHYENII